MAKIGETYWSLIDNKFRRVRVENKKTNNDGVRCYEVEIVFDKYLSGKRQVPENSLFEEIPR
ncbi:MAG TPA: hypothetical protein VJB11_03500 [archaeon]|nr:hypothetical protein [archaeon]